VTLALSEMDYRYNTFCAKAFTIDAKDEGHFMYAYVVRLHIVRFFSLSSVY